MFAASNNYLMRAECQVRRINLMSATPLPSSAGLSPLDGAEEAVARELGRLMIILPRVLDADLQREQRMSLSEYSALRHLSEKPHRRMRMSELAAACDMSLSGMTRLAGKLQSDGLVQRVRCERDARGLEAVLTEAGLARLQEAWPTHLASVRRHIFDHLTGIDMCKLATALKAVNGS
jgi:DNA-binding MarR family transcriptional regulator